MNFSNDKQQLIYAYVHVRTYKMHSFGFWMHFPCILKFLTELYTQISTAPNCT